MPTVLRVGNYISALATNVEVDDDTLSVSLSDGRTIAVPVARFPHLFHAHAEERNTWRLIAGGRGIHWTKLDEDISVANLLLGQPSGESQDSLRRWLAGRGPQPRKSKRLKTPSKQGR